MKRVLFFIVFLVAHSSFSQDGITSPISRLHIKGPTDAILSLQTTDDTWLYTQFLNSASIRKAWVGLGGDLTSFHVSLENGADKIIFNGGNVGIGTSNPSDKLTVAGDISSQGRISLKNSSTVTGDVISLYGNRFNATDMYGFGVEAGVLYSKTINSHRWYIGKNADSGVSSKMELNNTMLYVADKIGIGTNDTKGYALAVSGKVVAEEVKVALKTSWPDYVFKKEYGLPTLEEVEKHIKEKGHLENIPNEEEVVKNGINLGEMNAKLLQKIEEMTLYMIEQNKQMIDLKQRLDKVEVNSK